MSIHRPEPETSTALAEARPLLDVVDLGHVLGVLVLLLVPALTPVKRGDPAVGAADGALGLLCRVLGGGRGGVRQALVEVGVDGLGVLRVVVVGLLGLLGRGGGDGAG